MFDEGITIFYKAEYGFDKRKLKKKDITVWRCLKVDETTEHTMEFQRGIQFEKCMHMN